MPDRRVEAVLTERKMFFDEAWKAATVFEASFTSSNKSNWYDDARIIRGGYAMSFLASDFFDSWKQYAIANMPIRNRKRRESAAVELEASLADRAVRIKESVAVWRNRAEEAGVTLAYERSGIGIALFADAEFRDLHDHLTSGKLSEDEFQSMVSEVCARFKISPADLSQWQNSQDIHW